MKNPHNYIQENRKKIHIDKQYYMIYSIEKKIVSGGSYGF